jgi:hypothetical protein
VPMKMVMIKMATNTIDCVPKFCCIHCTRPVLSAGGGSGVPAFGDARDDARRRKGGRPAAPLAPPAVPCREDVEELRPCRVLVGAAGATGGIVVVAAVAAEGARLRERCARCRWTGGAVGEVDLRRRCHRAKR